MGDRRQPVGVDVDVAYVAHAFGLCFVCVQVTQMLHYWMHLMNDGTASEEKLAAAIMNVLQQRNALKTDEVCM